MMVMVVLVIGVPMVGGWVVGVMPVVAVAVATTVVSVGP